MKILEMYKKGRLENNKIFDLDIPKKIVIKSIIFSVIFSIIISLPFISIIASLLTVFSPVRTMFWVILGLVYIFLAIVYASGSAFNVILLKNYLETDEIKQIDTKCIFIRELFNPLILLAGILIDFMIYQMAL